MCNYLSNKAYSFACYWVTAYHIDNIHYVRNLKNIFSFMKFDCQTFPVK